MLKTIADPRLAALVVWQPMQGGTEQHVPDATTTFPDPRARHFWDGAGWTMAHFKPVLDIPVTAWDLYLIYDADARWDGPEPPRPRFWMHQLWGVENGPPLDAPAFGAEVAKALTALPAR